MFNKSSISGLALEAAGLVALADLSTVSVRTALIGTASWLDILVLAPGIHQQQSADQLNRGEFLKTGSLTNGYVSHVEIPATVGYLQRFGRTGYLVTALVKPKPRPNPANPLKNSYFDLSPPQYHPFYIAGVSVALLYLLCPILTIIVFALVSSIRDWWALAVLGMLVLCRTINVLVIKRRASDSNIWKWAREPGQGDLLVMLSPDRWLRLQGELSDIRRVITGEWLREEDRVYAAAALAGNASTIGSLLIALLLLCSVALLALCNSLTQRLQMHDYIVQEDKTLRKQYDRRLDMVKDLVEEVDRSGEQEGKRGAWAINMQLIQQSELDKIPLPESKSTTDYSKEREPSSGSSSTDALMC
ncbi:hypothetical protein ARMSODRAFT_1004889 [Armillaria solidipes]|uniref:Uncharacterized protein n=1 Tax=Armillaria solidipes TaxID=1076256 RepID=A0A2H3BUC2_9AGAR|nr:hypothetical protein ARMSODRAFT_1004889 [Armillaria solidipes]